MTAHAAEFFTVVDRRLTTQMAAQRLGIVSEFKTTV